MKPIVGTILGISTIAGIASVGCNARLYIDEAAGNATPGNDAGADASAVGNGTGGGSSGAVGAGGTGAGGGTGGNGGTGGRTTNQQPDPDSGTCRARACNEAKRAELRMQLGPRPPGNEIVQLCYNAACSNFSSRDIPDGGLSLQHSFYLGDGALTATVTITENSVGRELAVVFDCKPFDPNLRNGDDYAIRVQTEDGGETAFVKKRATYRSFVDGDGLSCVDVTLTDVAWDAGPEPPPCTNAPTFTVPIGVQALPEDAVELVDVCYNDQCAVFTPSEVFRQKPVFTTYLYVDNVGRSVTLQLTSGPSGAQFVVATFNWEPFDEFLQETDVYAARVGSLVRHDASSERGPTIFSSRHRATYRSFVQGSASCGDRVSCLDVTLTPVWDAGAP